MGVEDDGEVLLGVQVVVEESEEDRSVGARYYSFAELVSLNSQVLSVPKR